MKERSIRRAVTVPLSALALFAPALLALAFTTLLPSCSGRDDDSARLAAEHPPPFEMRATDSSIVGKYVWEDTLSDYYLAVTMEGDEGDTRFIAPRSGIAFPVAVPNREVEFLFRDLGIRQTDVPYGIWFLSDTHAGDEYGYKWMFSDGAFEPVIFENTRRSDLH